MASVRIAACAFRIHCIVFCEWSAEALERWSACGYLIEESALDMLRVVTAGLWFDGPMQLFAAEVLQGRRAGQLRPADHQAAGGASRRDKRNSREH